MNSLWKKMTIAVAVLLLLWFVMACVWGLAPAHPPLSMTVAGFVTNRYTAFAGEYVCAIISVTNTSRGSTFVCLPSSSGSRPFRPLYGAVSGTQFTSVKKAPKDYYAYQDGDFLTRTLPPHSGFSFEAFVLERAMTNEISLDVALAPSTTWIGRHLPNGVRNKLPAFFVGDSRFRRFVLTVAGFTERPLPSALPYSSRANLQRSSP